MDPLVLQDLRKVERKNWASVRSDLIRDNMLVDVGILHIDRLS